MIAGGIFLILLAATLTVGCIWSLSHVHYDYRGFLTHETPILIHHPGISFFYLIFPAFAGLLLFGCCAVISGMRQSCDDSNRQRCMRFSSYLGIIGLVLMFIGRFAGNWYWEETFRNAGYEPCASSFSITQKWDERVWVQETAFCDNEEVLRMFASYKHDLEDINEYLKTRATKK